ncbi:unnamed protein product [Trichobilharzia szidati]|nr:unnamed protein product [Trichobilharzia szidati]
MNTPDEFYTILCKLHTDLCTMDKPMTYTTNINGSSSISSCDISNSSEVNSINHLYMIVKERYHLWSSADHLIHGRLLDEKITLKVLKAIHASMNHGDDDDNDDIDAALKQQSESLSHMTTHQDIFQYLINIPIPSTSGVNLTFTTTTTVNSNTKTSLTGDTPSKKVSPANSDLLMPISSTVQSVKGKKSADCSPKNTNRTKSVECIVTGKLDNTLVDSISTKAQNQKPITFSQHEYKLRLIDILSRYGRLIAERVICFNSLYNNNHNNNIIDSRQKPSNWSLCHLLQSQMKITHQFNNNDSTTDCISILTFSELFKHLDDIYQRLIKLTSPTPTANDTIGVNVRLGNQALPSWLLLSSSVDGKLSKNFSKLGNMNCGSVGGRLVAFFILYMIVKKQYHEAVGYFIRLLYQIDEPPVGALRGVINCAIPSTSTSSFGIRRPCHATLENSMKTARSAHPWLLWLLRQIGWNDIAAYLEQQTPVLFPGGDYTLLGDHV